MKNSKRYPARRALQPSNRGKIRRSSRELKQAIVVFCSIIALGTVLLLTSVVIEQRQAALERARNDTFNLSAAFEEQVRRAIDSIRGSMSLLKTRLAAEGSTFDLVDWIAHAPEFAATTVQVAFVGPDGKLVSTSLERKPKPVDLSDREHVRVHLNGAVGLFIGKPVTGRISGLNTIQISDRVEGADGKLAGVLVFSLSPEFLTTLHRSVRLGKTGSMILAGTDAVIRASFAGFQKSDGEFIGKSVPGAKALTAALSNSSGSYEENNPLNSEPALFHWRKVADYPLIVIVGLERAEVLAVANRSAAMLAVLGAAVLALSFGMTLILHREITRRVQREIALFDESRKAVHANGDLQRRQRQILKASAQLSAERARLQIINKELGTAKELAEQANQAKTSLLMNMSHEFRTPLHAILNYTNMGLKKLSSNDVEKLKKYLGNIQISGIRLLGMLNALLELAKLESGKFDLRLSRGDLKQIVHQSQAEIDSLFEAKQIRLDFQVRAGDTAAVFDEQQMMQVFINLFSNALKFSPQKGLITVTIESTALAGTRPALHCSVADEGPGIPEAELEAIFDKFTQSTKTDNGAGGSGLGLAICREILHLHRGRIWASNAGSGGAIFHVVLPKDLATHDAGTALSQRGGTARPLGISPNSLN
ncbi:MAG: ATP-binding protein [Rhodomicrobium sp.]